MKKQTLIIISLFVFLFSGSALAKETLWDQMEIQGRFDQMDARSAIQPLEIYKSNQLKQLCVCYNRPFGQLEITIVDELNNQVYESNINVTTVTQEIISIGYLGKGNYTIYITNSEGKFVSGDFDIY